MSEAKNEVQPQSGDLERVVISTTERTVKYDDKIVCSWREGIDRENDNKPVLIIDINNSQWLENKDWDEMTKHDCCVFAKSLEILVRDAEDHGL